MPGECGREGAPLNPLPVPVSPASQHREPHEAESAAGRSVHSAATSWRMEDTNAADSLQVVQGGTQCLGDDDEAMLSISGALGAAAQPSAEAPSEGGVWGQLNAARAEGGSNASPVSSVRSVARSSGLPTPTVSWAQSGWETIVVLPQEAPVVNTAHGQWSALHDSREDAPQTQGRSLPRLPYVRLELPSPSGSGQRGGGAAQAGSEQKGHGE